MEKEQNKDKKIKLKEENLKVDKKKVETGRVKISKKVLNEEIPIDLTGFVEDVEIERKKINKVVQAAGPAVREEGDATVFSLYKEVYVKQLILEEEVWVSRKKMEKSFKGKEKLKREVIDIERTSEDSVQKK